MLIRSKVNVWPVSPAENLDAMIAMQTKNKLGKSLGPPEFIGPNGKQPQSYPPNISSIHKIMHFCSTQSDVFSILSYAEQHRLNCPSKGQMCSS